MKQLLLFCAVLFGLSISIQAANITFDIRQNYIETYGQIAIQEMNRSGIPASIILAQGILESQWGQGYLADNGNNHFGIKCNNGWTGNSLDRKDDDYKNGILVESCFRAYENVLESYQDHTDFLLYRDRYQKLFNFDKTDYANWAYGLKECGYATDSQYPEKLIRIIEENGLAIYDFKGKIESSIIDNINEVLDFEFYEMPENVFEKPNNDYLNSIEDMEEDELIWEQDEDYIEVKPNNSFNENILKENQTNYNSYYGKNNYKNRIQEIHQSPDLNINRR